MLGCLPEGPGPARGEPCGAQTLCYAMLCLLVQMPANHGVKRNSPHVALLQVAYRQTRPEAKIYKKTIENIRILRPREAPGCLPEGPGRPPGGPREAPRSIPRLHMSTKGLKNFAVSDFPTFPPRKTPILKRGDVRFPILPRFLKENAKRSIGVSRGTL